MKFNFRIIKYSTKELLDFGINQKLIKSFSINYGINSNKRFVQLKKKLYLKLSNRFKYLRVGKFLQKSISKNIEFLIKIKSYKGIRHKLKYPARGQRTHTNAKTKKKILYKKF